MSHCLHKCGNMTRTQKTGCVRVVGKKRRRGVAQNGKLVFAKCLFKESFIWREGKSFLSQLPKVCL